MIIGSFFLSVMTTTEPSYTDAEFWTRATVGIFVNMFSLFAVLIVLIFGIVAFLQLVTKGKFLNDLEKSFDNPKEDFNEKTNTTEIENVKRKNNHN